jgi:hypothetical protein
MEKGTKYFISAAVGFAICLVIVFMLNTFGSDGCEHLQIAKQMTEMCEQQTEEILSMRKKGLEGRAEKDSLKDQVLVAAQVVLLEKAKAELYKHQVELERAKVAKLELLLKSKISRETKNHLYVKR